MKLLVTGSRGWTDKEKIFDWFNQYEGDIDLIIHGGAKGVDTFAEEYAIKNNINSRIVRPVKSHIPVYYLHRNAEMIGMCDEVVAFWDGESRGTKFTIDYARARGKKVTVVIER